MKIPPLYLNVDTKHGLGHKMRTWAIAEEWLRCGGIVHWTWDEFPDEMCVAVFDGYFYTNRQRERWRDAGLIVVTFDDYERSDFSTHILVNYNYGISDKLPCFSKPRIPGISILLLGTKYFPLRNDYKKLISIDGKHPFDADSANREMEPNVFAKKMSKCSYVLTSAGGTVYEVMYLRKPILLRLANSTQAVTYKNVIKDGLALQDGPEARKMMCHADIRRKYAERVSGLVDGQGATRIVEEIVNVLG